MPIGQGNVDLPAATFLIILALAYFLADLGVRFALARSRRTSLCVLCREVTWNGELCKRCERVAGA